MAELMIFLSFVVAICISAFLASEMSNIAEQKGYEQRRYFHICFWLGLFGFLIVIALPDKVLLEKLEASNRPLSNFGVGWETINDDLPQL